jgi:hypothetical protein
LTTRPSRSRHHIIAWLAKQSPKLPVRFVGMCLAVSHACFPLAIRLEPFRRWPIENAGRELISQHVLVDVHRIQESCVCNVVGKRNQVRCGPFGFEKPLPPWQAFIQELGQPPRRLCLDWVYVLRAVVLVQGAHEGLGSVYVSLSLRPGGSELSQFLLRDPDRPTFGNVPWQGRRLLRHRY